MVNLKERFDIKDKDCIEKSMRFLESGLKSAGVEPHQAIRTQLLFEEMLSSLIDNSLGKGDIRVQIKKVFGDAVITISSKGREYDLFDDKGELTHETEDDEAEEVIRSLILRSHGENLKYSHRKGINSVRIVVGDASISATKLTVLALALGILLGLIIKLTFPDAASAAVCDYLLSPIVQVFMSALKMIIAPVVFFSIVTSMSGFSDMSELGRIGARVMSLFVITTLIAVTMSYGLTTLISPGEFGAAAGMEAGQAVDVATNVDTSLLSTIINIVPSNFVRPFLESDTLQLIFLAVLVGLALGRIGKYTPVLSEFFEACNSLFLTITGIITKFIPLIVFCSISQMLIKIGGRSFVTLLGYCATDVLENLIMVGIHGLLVLLIGKLNPLKFFRNAREGMITSFTLSSSSAAMPVNIKTCVEKMGVSPRVCNFSIPLGATINMDGTCISLIIQTLYLAKMYGVDINPSMILPLLLTVVLLSFGCPGVPGVGIVCLGILLQQIGVPLGAISLILVVDPILDMFDTLSNTTGDVACTVIAARQEGLLDRDVYDK